VLGVKKVIIKWFFQLRITDYDFTR